MANPYHDHAKSHAKGKLHTLTGGFKKGGRPYANEATERKAFTKAFHDHGESKVHGYKSGGRLDKHSRGGKGKTVHNHVTVVASKPPAPMAGPPPVARPPMAPVGGPAAPTPMPPPGMSAGPMPSPMMRKHGGFVKKYARGGVVKDDANRKGQPRNEEKSTLDRGEQEHFLKLRARGGRADIGKGYKGRSYIEGEADSKDIGEWKSYAKGASYHGKTYATGGAVKPHPLPMPTKPKKLVAKKVTGVWAKKNPANRKEGKIAKMDGMGSNFGRSSGMGALEQAKGQKRSYP